MRSARPIPIPVLTNRIRRDRRRQDRVRAEYKAVTRIAIQDALALLATEACARLEDGRDHLGAMWEAAHAYMIEHAQRMTLQAEGGVMEGARRALSTIVPDETCDDEFHPAQVRTPEQEIDSRLAEEWLTRSIDSLEPRRRAIMRQRLGINDADDDELIEGMERAISKQRISQIGVSAERRLSRSWRSDLEKSIRLLDPDHDRAVAALAEIATRTSVRKVSVAAEKRSTERVEEPGSTTIRRTRPPQHVLLVCGIAITRIGHDSYAVEGCGILDADGVGALIHGVAEERQVTNVNAMLTRRDLWIANGYRGARRGAQWPHPVGDVPRLPLVPS
jgi:hypothetical protein